MRSRACLSLEDSFSLRWARRALCLSALIPFWRLAEREKEPSAVYTYRPIVTVERRILLCITWTLRCKQMEWSTTPTALALGGGGESVKPASGQCRWSTEIRPSVQTAALKRRRVSAWSGAHTAHTTTTQLLYITWWKISSTIYICNYNNCTKGFQGLLCGC